MKVSIILTLIANSISLALAGVLSHPEDGNDGCGAQCQAIKGGLGMGISSPTCLGVTGDYCEANCLCSGIGELGCTNTKGLKILGSNNLCSNDAITKICEQGLRNQWECWCQNLLSDGWGPGANAGETCVQLFG